MVCVQDNIAENLLMTEDQDAPEADEFSLNS